MKKEICILIVMVFLISFISAQGWLEGDSNTGDGSGSVVPDTQSEDLGFGWDNENDEEVLASDTSSSNPASSQTYEPNPEDYEFTTNFYISLILGIIAIILIVLWIIFLRKSVK